MEEWLIISLAALGALSENSDRSEGKLFWDRFFDYLKRIIINIRKIWPK